MLLGATDRPLWADNNWIVPLFLVSAASTGAAALVLLLTRTALPGIRRFHLLAIGIEALFLILFLQSLGAQAVMFMSGAFARLFWGGLVLVGGDPRLDRRLRPPLPRPLGRPGLSGRPGHSPPARPYFLSL